MVTKHLRIRGRVQGVGFRMYMQREAERLNVAGWVRNRSDGSVEAVIQGDAEAVDSMIACARRGPSSARVTSVDAREVTGVFRGFEMRATE